MDAAQQVDTTATGLVHEPKGNRADTKTDSSLSRPHSASKFGRSKRSPEPLFDHDAHCKVLTSVALTATLQRGREVSKVRAMLVYNFPSGTGFAWRFITELYGVVDEAFASCGIEALSAFPEATNNSTDRHHAETGPVIGWDVNARGPLHAWRTFLRFRSLRVRAIYLSDQPLLRIAYLLWRLAGVRQIVVHEHTSGTRTCPRGLRRVLKWMAWRVPGLGANLVIGVSDFVAIRLRTTALIPEARLRVVRNGVHLPALSSRLRAKQTATVVSIARATDVKGIHILLDAWRILMDRWPSDQERPRLLYAGDGPQLTSLRAQVRSLGLEESVEMLGYREDVNTLFTQATLCVVPSIWAEAFCLVAAEALSFGVPVVGTNLGALPEVLGNPIPGAIVPAGDREALAMALLVQLTKPATELNVLGELGRMRMRAEFDITRTMKEMRELMKYIAVSCHTR